MRIWRLMGHYNAETSTYSACAGAGQTSPWTPDFNGTLVGLKTQMSLAAATSLTGHIQFRLSCAAWTPNQIEVFAQGSGLKTAPAFPENSQEFSVVQKIVAGTPVTVEGRCLDSVPVTVECYIYGCFET